MEFYRSSLEVPPEFLVGTFLLGILNAFLVTILHGVSYRIPPVVA